MMWRLGRPDFDAPFLNGVLGWKARMDGLSRLAPALPDKPCLKAAVARICGNCEKQLFWAKGKINVLGKTSP